MSEMRNYSKPPQAVHDVLIAALLILGDPEDTTKVGTLYFLYPLFKSKTNERNDQLLKMAPVVGFTNLFTIFTFLPIPLGFIVKVGVG